VLDAWNITKSLDACSYCGRELAENRPFYSALSENEGDLARSDFCAACWDRTDNEPFFCFWRARRNPRARKRTVDTGLMIEFFDRLAQPDSEKKKVFRFVLALYLMRRKEFKLTGIRRGDGREEMVFSRRSSGDEAVVENPGLDEEQIQEASEQLTGLLNAAL